MRQPEVSGGSMLHNYLVTALRNLARNRLYAAIIVLGLAVAFAAALLIAQFVRNEFSYDRWVTNYQKVYKLSDVGQSPGQPPMARIKAPCNNAFPEEVRKLPGVEGAVCSSIEALNTPNAKGTLDEARPLAAALDDVAPVDFGFFELYGVHSLAGRLFRRDHGEDGVLTDPNNQAMPTVVINETAAHVLGFPNPRAAVGKAIIWTLYLRPLNPGPTARPNPLTAPSTIIGVVPDAPVTVRAVTAPTFYLVWPKQYNVLSIKLTGQDVPGTIKAIAATWKRVNGDRPMVQGFLAQDRLTLYLDLIIQGVTIGICAILAVLIACLGLFGLSAYTTERRIQEIGVRKALGANTHDVVFLLLWQFTVPVLAAIAIALPLSFLAMTWWLHGFAYHVDLSVWTFVAAAVAAVAIAWLTVSYQSFMVARAKPVGALRFE
jgi:putative ABC transport system permease protein